MSVRPFYKYSTLRFTKETSKNNQFLLESLNYVELCTLVKNHANHQLHYFLENRIF
jgi:hypothetical protein